jgi:diguanylate cyclase (GGDEF)-like protein
MLPHSSQDPDGADGATAAPKLFWGSLLLSVLIIVHLLFMARAVGGTLALIRSFLPAVLLWSLVLTAYSFHVMHRAARRSAEKLSRDLTDQSTGVFTLSYLHSCLENERQRADQMGVPAAVAYLDLVNLERVNREFGHTVGDIVLKAAAQLLANNVRSGDVVGRVGGDEFLIIMPETNLQQARRLLRDIRAAIENYELDLGNRGKIDFLSCRVGLAVFPAEGGVQEIVSVARSKMAPQPVEK